MKAQQVVFITLLCLTALLSCHQVDKAPAKNGELQMYKSYPVHKLTELMTIDADWEKPQWQRIKALDIGLLIHSTVNMTILNQLQDFWR